MGDYMTATWWCVPGLKGGEFIPGVMMLLLTKVFFRANVNQNMKLIVLIWRCHLAKLALVSTCNDAGDKDLSGRTVHGDYN